ncbi:MAG: PD40 domain-containing protein [Saprospiraceae bacterium]|nr:PD40 domain-containing protein [Candidatus Vicinibacter affinis]MBK8644261.1 PD40 domain-containing protein [Candidatus Vicinibacter affinis]
MPFNLRQYQIFLILITGLLISNPTKAQKEEAKWDVAKPDLPTKSFTLITEEGTWMNLDVSPDGKTIVFDLMGDIFTIPMAGGSARILRSGLPYEVQPRYSPDGKKISFTSDAGGGDNIWIMNADGSHPQQVTKEKFRLLNNAVWMPDGEYLVARKHFTSQRSLGAGEMWMYHYSGGSGIQLTERKNDQQDVNEPYCSPDGRYVYFSEDMYDGGSFQYNKDPNNQIFIIRRYDRKEGKVENVIGGPGSAFRPTLSRDGKKIAYIRRDRTKTTLIIHDLATGEEKMICSELSKDQQEAWTVFGIYTGFNWTPDDKSIIIWAQGKIKKIDIATSEITNIPFKVEVEHTLIEPCQSKQICFAPEIKIHALRQTKTSPDGKMIVFNAVGQLYQMQLPKGKPKRLTTDTHLEFEPSFSPDGKELLYVIWDDEKMGSIIRLNLATGNKTVLTSEKGIYRTPSFSPDGKMVVYRKEAGNDHQGYQYVKNPGIYIMPSSGGKATLVSPGGEYPYFSNNNDRIFFQTGGYLFGSLSKSLKSIGLDGKDEKTIFTSTYANQFVPSPDNKWVAFTELYKVYIAAMPLPGKSIVLNKETNAIPMAQVTDKAGVSLHWSSDSKQLHWTQGNEYYTEELRDRFKFLRNETDSLPPYDSNFVEINLSLPSDMPKGIIALTNARIITMEGNQVIENGCILIENNKIKEVGTLESLQSKIPANAKIMDLSGKTIMPGMIDVHAHVGAFRYGLSPQKHWQYWTNLAYGVTTTHDPSTNSEMAFSQSEMVKTGAMVGPRIFSTGTILYGADGDFKATIDKYEDAVFALKRTKSWGAFSVKSYNQPRREQRQMVIKAAKELGMLVVPEGGSFFYHNMSQVADGHTGVEHNIPVAPLYKDVLNFWKASGSHNTPTLIVNYGSVNGEYYWYQNTEVWNNKKLLRFTPRHIIDGRSRHRTMIPQEEYDNGHILTSKSCKALQDNGVNINLGSHGQIQGIGAHWELWMFVQGGMSPMQALRSATLNGAKYIGMDQEIGSIKAGKLADLVIMEKNPLDDIRNSESITHTMINGRLYNAEDMEQIYPENKKRTKFYWELPGAVFPFDVNGQSNTSHGVNCSCQGLMMEGQ